MPYISVSTSLPLSKEQKKAVKTGFGKLISIIPGKSEGGLMLDIGDSRSFYLRGEEAEAAYVNIKMLGKAGDEAKAELTAAVFLMLEETTGLKPDNVYLSYDDYENWGLKGKYI